MKNLELTSDLKGVVAVGLGTRPGCPLCPKALDAHFAKDHPNRISEKLVGRMMIFSSDTQLAWPAEVVGRTEIRTTRATVVSVAQVECWIR